DWAACEVERDDTGGFNRPGDVLLHVPASHQPDLIARHRAGWLRCRILPAVGDQPEYTASPRITAIRAFTIGGTVGIVHAETIHDEIIGVSDGAPGQRFVLQRRPVLRADRPTVLRVSGGAADGGWTEWLPVADFARSAEHDRHYRLEPVAGEVQFGPAVRQPDGGLHQYGPIPPKGSTLQTSAYRVGGGSGGENAPAPGPPRQSHAPFIPPAEEPHPASAGGAGAT